MTNSKNILYKLIAIMTLLVSSSAASYAVSISADCWENLGKEVIYFSGCNHRPPEFWISPNESISNALAEPDSTQSIAAIEEFLEQALTGYAQNSFAWQGRIPLNENAHCILGLYLTEKFPGTKLGDWGTRLFNQSIEQSCLVVLGTEIPWKERLETELTKINENSIDNSTLDSFDTAEQPFLLIYLLKNSSSKEVRLHARKLLARYLLERYGLAPALEQYRLLLLDEKYVDVNEHTQLQVSQLFEQTGATTDAQRLYAKILEDTNASEIARTAAENLTRIRLSNSQQNSARQVLNVLHKRFPDTRLSSEELESFFLNFQTDREKRAEQLTGELLTAQKQEEILKLCKIYSDLWTKEEALERWQYITDHTEPESPAWQCARLYLSLNLVDTGKVNEANGMLNSLSGSTYPTIRARAFLISADIAKKMDRISDAVSLYQQAAQIERPMALPEWFKNFYPKQADVEKLTADELSFFASFLSGYNEMLDGNFETGAANLLKANETISTSSQKSFTYNVKETILPMLMLAYLKTGDYARAEEYGLRAMRALGENEQDSKQLSNLQSQIEQVDNSLFVLSGELRTLPKRTAKSQLARYARNVYTAITAQNPLNTDLGPANRELGQLLHQIRRQRAARLLSAEYDLARTRPTQSDSLEEFLNLEPIAFTAQLLLHEDSLEQIIKALTAATPQEYTKGQMYRFAEFAEQVGQPYMARMALDAAVDQIDNTSGNIQSLENIADMYLRNNSNQKAIEIYERIVNQASDSNEAETAQLKVIKLYAEHLKLNDKALLECQRFLKKFPDSPKVSHVEFLIGKLDYLDKDYAGAIGQLDVFQRKYPDNPQTGEAAMLAALSRMAEGNTQDAIERFREIIQKYPKGELAARSKFLIGYEQVSEQKYAQAVETFKQLVEQFPKSEYTKQAQSFIDRLSKVSQ
jgi:TolA-binding protein